VSKNDDFRQKTTFFEGGWHTFCPIISDRLRFKGCGFQDSDLGSLALLGYMAHNHRMTIGGVEMAD